MKKIEVSTIILEADEGMMLTDGRFFGETVYLGNDRDVNEFREITIEEYNEIMAEQEESEET